MELFSQLLLPSDSLQREELFSAFELVREAESDGFRCLLLVEPDTNVIARRILQLKDEAIPKDSEIASRSLP